MAMRFVFEDLNWSSKNSEKCEEISNLMKSDKVMNATLCVSRIQITPKHKRNWKCESLNGTKWVIH